MTGRTQTSIASALQRAGYNTAEHRLRLAGLDALKKHHRNIARALPTFERAVGDDPELVREALLFFLCRLGHEMLGQDHALHGSHSERVEARQPNGGECDQNSGVTHPPRVASPPRFSIMSEPSPAQKGADGAIARSLAKTVLDTRKTADGRAWGDVGAHEWDGLDRDGAIGRALKAHVGPLSNAQRFMKTRELVSPERFEIIWLAARGQSDGA